MKVAPAPVPSLAAVTRPRQWATHCHNIYHAEAGMMINLAYRA